MLPFLEGFIQGYVYQTAILLIAIRYCAVFRHPMLGHLRRWNRDFGRSCTAGFLVIGLGYLGYALLNSLALPYICTNCDPSSLTLKNDGGIAGLLLLAGASLFLLENWLILLGDAIRFIHRHRTRILGFQHRIKTIFWRGMVGFTSLLVIVVFSLLMSSCTSFYERARLRFATTKADTVYTQIPIRVPADSVGFTLPTDTTTIIREYHHDRARVVFKRDKNQTSVQAYCDTLVITKKVATQITTQHWGVNPKYKRQAETRLSIIWGLLVFIALLLILFWLSHRYQFTVTRKPNDTGANAGAAA